MEDRIKIGSRDQLIDVLSEAAELEHNLCCSYLFAGFSLKGDGDGLSEDQCAAVRRWKQVLREIATQEMLHLALTSNLLMAIGAAPHFGRPNFPQASKHYPPEIRVALTRFDADTLDHFIYIERPDGADEEEGSTFTSSESPQPAAQTTDIVPQAQDYVSVSELYRGVEQGFRDLVDKLGEERVFIGPSEDQATPERLDFPGLIAVSDLASAVQAVNLIIEQGEGAPRNQNESHYAQFLQIRKEFQEIRQQSPEFDPSRPVLDNPFTRVPSDADAAHVMTDPLTVEVADLFNGAYAAMLDFLLRFFAHTEESDDELKTLIGTAIGIMSGVLAPLGETLTALPAGEEFTGQTGGPSFQVYRASAHRLPSKRAAWFLLKERLLELSEFCEGLTSRSERTARLHSVQQTLAGLAADL